MQTEKIKVFILEDVKTDQELVKRQVLKFNPHAIMVMANNKESFEEKIHWFEPDLILSDYNLPDLNGMEALQYAKKHLLHVPFVHVTGALDSEEKAAQAILNGADGYVLKDNLDSLPQVLEGVINKNKEEKNLAQAKQERERQSKISLQKLTAKVELLEDQQLKEEFLQIIAKIKFY